MQFREYATRWEETVAAVTAPETVATRRTHIKTHIIPAFGHMRVEEVTQHAVQNFISSLTATLSPKSVRNVWGTLQCILGDAERESLIAKVPRPRFMRVGSAEQPRFSLPQIKMIIAAAPTVEARALYWFLAETGVRIDEALELTWDKIMQGAEVKLEGTKTFAARRTITLSDPLWDIMSSFWTLKLHTARHERLIGAQQDKLVFDRSETYYRDRLNTLLVALGIDSLGKAPFHAFRRTARTLWGQIGMPWDLAEYRIGHALPGVTGKYRFFDPGEDKVWATKIAEALR